MTGPNLLLLIGALAAIAAVVLFVIEHRGRHYHDWWLGLGVASSLAALLLALVGGCFAFVRLECHEQLTAAGRDGRWSVAAGCLVADDSGHLVPLDNYRFTEEQD